MGLYNENELPEVVITGQSTNTTNTADTSIWDGVFSNMGGWLTGAAQVIAATKGTPQPGQVGYVTPPPVQRSSNMWLIVGGLAVLGLIVYMLVAKKK